MTSTLSSLPQAGIKDYRLGWRVILGLIMLYVTAWIVRVIMGVGPNILMRWLGATPDFRAYVGSTLNYGVGIVSYIIFSSLALKKVLHTDPKSIFFPLHKGWWKYLLSGFVLVTAVLVLFFVAEQSAGWLIVDSWAWQTLSSSAWLRTAWVAFLINVGVAIGEETIFRGYLLTGLKAAWGKWPGLIIMMVIFGLFHLPAYAEGGMQSGTLTLAILPASLFGFLFGLVYLRTGSLWLPISLHFAWNFVENDVLNMTADPNNVNLIGAVTRLQRPFSLTEIGLGNVVIMETLMFWVIALCLWLYLKYRHVDRADLPT